MGLFRQIAIQRYLKIKYGGYISSSSESHYSSSSEESSSSFVIPEAFENQIVYLSGSKERLYALSDVQSHLFSNGFGTITFDCDVLNVGKCMRATNATSIYLPPCVASIDSDAFSGCDSLTDIYAPWHEGAVSGSPWGASNSVVIHYEEYSSSSEEGYSSSSSEYASSDYESSSTDEESSASYIESSSVEESSSSSSSIPLGKVITYYADSKATLYSTIGLESHEFDNGIGTITLREGISTFGSWLRGTAITDVVMPESITTIGSNAFYGCTSLNITEMPEHLETIGYNAFYGCTSLALTELPESVEMIESNAFYNCSSLALTELPESITMIGNSAFYGCTGVSLESIPSGVTSIGQKAFYGCTGLTEMKLSESLAVLGSQAFYGCSSLTKVVFDSTITTLSSGIFTNCSSLADIYVPWASGYVSNAPWGASSATVHYNYIVPTGVLTKSSTSATVEGESGVLMDVDLSSYFTATNGNSVYLSGSLPTGLSFDGTKIIGTPRYGDTDTYTISVNAFKCESITFDIVFAIEGEQNPYPSSTQVGTYDNPWYWDKIVDSSYGNKKHTVAFNCPSNSSNRAYIYVYLTSGVQYTFGVSYTSTSYDTYFRLFDSSGNQVAYNDDSSTTIDGVYVYSYTTYSPSTSGWYKFCACTYSDRSAMVGATAHMTPEPLLPGGESSSSSSSSSSDEDTGSSSMPQMTVSYDGNGGLTISNAEIAYDNGTVTIDTDNTISHDDDTLTI